MIRLGDRSVRIEGIYPSFPSFSATGSELVAAHSAPGSSGRTWLVVSNSEGTNLRTIVDPEGQIISTSWSANGEWIVYAEGLPFALERTRVDLWRVRPDGRDRRRLTDGRANAAFPDLAADGRRIVYRGGQSGSKDIYLTDSDGTNTRALTQDTFIDTMPTVSPDGAWVVFSSDRWALAGTSVRSVLAATHAERSAWSFGQRLDARARAVRWCVRA